jgi:hypothetical protein
LQTHLKKIQEIRIIKNNFFILLLFYSFSLEGLCTITTIIIVNIFDKRRSGRPEHVLSVRPPHAIVPSSPFFRHFFRFDVFSSYFLFFLGSNAPDYMDPLTRPYGGFNRGKKAPLFKGVRDVQERSAEGSEKENDPSSMALLEHVALVSLTDSGSFRRTCRTDKHTLALRVPSGSSSAVVSLMPKHFTSKYVSVSSRITTFARTTNLGLNHNEDVSLADATRVLPFFEKTDGFTSDTPHPLHLAYRIFTDSGSRLEVLLDGDANMVAGELSWAPAAQTAVVFSVGSVGPVGSVRLCWRSGDACVIEADTGKKHGAHMRIEIAGKNASAWQGDTQSVDLPPTVLPEQWSGSAPKRPVHLPPPICRTDLINQRIKQSLDRQQRTHDVERYQIWIAGAIRKLTRAFTELTECIAEAHPRQGQDSTDFGEDEDKYTLPKVSLRAKRKRDDAPAPPKATRKRTLTDMSMPPDITLITQDGLTRLS